MEMNPVKEKCVDLAEFYEIDWYMGEFASVFRNRHNTDEFNLEQLEKVHQASCQGNQDWGNARSKVIAKLEELQGRSPSIAGNPSWLRDPITDAKPSMRDGNVRWIEGSDPEMTAAICRAQIAFVEFTKTLGSASPEEALVKGFFAHPADPMIGEHIYLDAPSILGSTIQGELWFESTGIPGLNSGQKRSIDITRLSDWFYVVDGKSFGGYSLPVLAAGMAPEDLEEAREYPPFCWYDL